jgi:hypothetical protein
MRPIGTEQSLKSVVERHRFDADTNPDSDPDPDPTSSYTLVEKTELFYF